MESIQAAVKEHIQGKLREIGSTLDEERRELSVRVCLFRCTAPLAMLPASLYPVLWGGETTVDTCTGRVP